MINAALEYIDMGYSIIPIQANKKPYVKWIEFQKKAANREQVAEWWGKWPDAMIGMVSGKVSGIYLVDADSETAGKHIRETCPDIIDPQVKTPNGWHWWFKSDEDIPCHNFRNSANVDMDVKGEGGYGIVPPSKNGEKAYRFLGNADLKDVPKIPLVLYNYIYKYSNILHSQHLSTPSTPVNTPFSEGSRDEDLFSLAHALVKGGMPNLKLRNFLHFFAQKCSPPFSPAEADIKIESALQRRDRYEGNLHQEVLECILSTKGYFLSTDVHKELHLSTRSEKKNLSVILNRLCDEGVIQRFGEKRGQFRIVEDDEVDIDIFAEYPEGLDIKYPLNLHELYATFEKTIACFVGSPDAGKTTFALNFLALNLDNPLQKRMLISEGESELVHRLKKFDIPLEKWGAVSFKSVSSGWADYVIPDGLNVVDYVEAHDGKFYMIGQELNDIYNKLTTGVCVVCLQKKFSGDMAYGAEITMKRARLYISLTQDPPQGGIAKIMKLKNKQEGLMYNPDYRQCHYQIIDGTEINMLTDWVRGGK